MNTSPVEYLPTTSTDMGTVTLGRTTYKVTEHHYAWVQDGVTTRSSDIHLTGPRGATYLLRKFLYRNPAHDRGMHQVISLGSGNPLRVQGNEVRVIVVGDIIEVA